MVMPTTKPTWPAVSTRRSVWPFVVMMALTIALVMLFPQLALWLPEHMNVKG